MKKLTTIFLTTTCLCFLSLSGCGGGGGENKVIEAPPAVEEEAAMPGMTDEEYDAAMDADMEGSDE